ncbi:MAG: PEGA domain-containing protein [Candidatus Saccharibacteria bacterium]|nr:PEGA domain-containing protein [Candidatus Saccharibacteria bacterium]
MYSEKKAQRQNLRVIISETFMVFSVIIMVIILAFVVSGYWLNADFKIERQGMLQVSSSPTGANVTIDDASPWFQRTNTSKVLSSGEHTVKLTKSGYDSWSKIVNIQEGLLYSLRYPRLFPLERKKEAFFSLPTATFATVSPDSSYMLIVNNTTEWLLLNLDSDKAEPKKVDVMNLVSSTSSVATPETGIFDGKIINADWSTDSEHILLEIVKGDTSLTEWILLNVKDVKSSLNLTREFAADFDKISILDHNASALLAIRNHNLHKIDTSARQISAVLVEDVISYDYLGTEIFFVAQPTASVDNDSAALKEPSPRVGLINLRNNKLTALDIPASTSSTALISKFYDSDYLTIIDTESVTIYLKDTLETIFSSRLDFTPEKAKVGINGEFIVIQNENRVATVDMEALKLSEWSLDSLSYGWLDGSMLYAVKDGKLIIYDFDGLNRRELSSNVSGHFPVTITNNKWLYYFSDDDVVREEIISQ